MEIRSLDERIDDLIRTIKDDASAEIEAIRLQTAQSEAEILKEGEHQARLVRQAIIDKAQQDALKHRDELKSAQQLKEKKALLEHREALLQAVFDEVEVQLSQVVRMPEYRKVLPEIMRESLLSLEMPDAILHFDVYTRGLITEESIHEMSKALQMQIRIGENLETGFGVIATDQSAKRQFDNTLQARLYRKKKFLRSEIYRILMGEME